MAKRLLAVIDSTDADGPYKARARVYRDTEWEEWRVRYYHGDELLSYMGEESDSFHNDQADAMGTAELQVKALAKRDLTSVWLPDEHDGLTERDPRRARKKYEDNPGGVPEQIRIDRKKSAQGYKVIATFGLMDTKTFFVADWKTFLEQRGWSNIPRVFA